MTAEYFSSNHHVNSTAKEDCFSYEAGDKSRSNVNTPKTTSQNTHQGGSAQSQEHECKQVYTTNPQSQHHEIKQANAMKSELQLHEDKQVKTMKSYDNNTPNDNWTQANAKLKNHSRRKETKNGEKWTLEKYFTTQPNMLPEKWKPILLPAEYLILDHIVYKTLGFGKLSDKIPISQFVNEIGLRKQTVVETLRALEFLGAIYMKKSGYINEYMINIEPQFEVNGKPITRQTIRPWQIKERERKQKANERYGHRTSKSGTVTVPKVVRSPDRKDVRSPDPQETKPTTVGRETTTGENQAAEGKNRTSCCFSLSELSFSQATKDWALGRFSDEQIAKALEVVKQQPKLECPDAVFKQALRGEWQPRDSADSVREANEEYLASLARLDGSCAGGHTVIVTRRSVCFSAGNSAREYFVDEADFRENVSKMIDAIGLKSA